MFSKKQHSEFDPHDRGLTRLQRNLQRFFPERQIIVRTEERMRTLRLTTMRQTVATVIISIVGTWLLISSGLVMNHEDRIRAKNTEIKDARSGYEQLLAQVSVYKRRIDEITEELDENAARMVSLADRKMSLADRLTPQGVLAFAARQKKPVYPEQEVDQRWTTDPSKINVAIGRLDLERGRAIDRRLELKSQLELLRSDMTDVSRVHEDTAFVNPDSLELREVLLERDLAAAERDQLSDRVNEMEELLREMESTQLLLFQRFAEVADEKIDQIDSSISSTGLDVETLLDSRSKDYGTGGPFIPLDAVPGEEGPLHQSLNDLNLKVDRLTSLQNLIAVMPLDKPLSKYWITSGFGVRKDPFTGQLGRHLGLDFGGPYKSPILSPGEGKVVYAGWRGRYGRMVEIDHGMGLRSRYAHLAKVLVEEGEYVGRGTTIALLGSSGRSSGPHLHFEVLYKNKALNPLKFIRAGTDVLEN